MKILIIEFKKCGLTRKTDKKSCSKARPVHPVMADWLINLPPSRGNLYCLPPNIVTSPVSSKTLRQTFWSSLMFFLQGRNKYYGCWHEVWWTHQSCRVGVVPIWNSGRPCIKDLYLLNNSKDSREVYRVCAKYQNTSKYLGWVELSIIYLQQTYFTVFLIFERDDNLSAYFE